MHHQIIHHTAAPTGSNYVDLTGKLQKLKIGPSQPSHREKPFHATIYSGVKLILLHGLSVLNQLTKQVPVQGHFHVPIQRNEKWDCRASGPLAIYGPVSL